jgi:hypothetical protein
MPLVFTDIDPRWINYREPPVVISRRSDATLGVPQVNRFIFIVNPVNKVFSDILALRNVENTNGYTFQPSERALNFALNYAWTLRLQFSQGLRVPKVIPDGEGGIDLRWKSHDLLVNLSCKSSDRHRDFIYWKEHTSHYEGREASIDLLKERLRWLQNAA